VDSSPDAGEGYRRLILTMPKCEGYRYRGERCREAGMLIPRKGDAYMRREGIPMPRGVILNDQE
jgi:hypothetical protein